MAEYKIIQDIEAEDKLLGPLSLRQFIYAAIAVIAAFLGFKLFFVSFILVIPFLPIVALFATLAVPFSKEQSTEMWLLARFRFFLKPRLRIWHQGSSTNLVAITIPKKVEKTFTSKYTQQEAESKLKSLAKTIDTRGWVIKDVNVNLSAEPSYLSDQNNSDRLVTIYTEPEVSNDLGITPSDDIYEDSNPKAQKIDSIITKQQQDQRDYHQKLAAGKVSPAPVVITTTPMGQTKTFTASEVVTPGEEYVNPSSEDEAEKMLLKKIKLNRANDIPAYGHTKVINPISQQPIVKPTPIKTVKVKAKPTPVTPQYDNAILGLARDNNRSVASLEKEGKKAKQQEASGEVVVSLH